MSEWFQAFLAEYQAAMRKAHLQGIAKLFSTKNTLEEMTLETGQKVLVAYDRAPEERKKLYEHEGKEVMKKMPELLTISEVARVLRVDATTVRRWVKEGTLEAIILPHARERQAYRIKREALDRVLGESVQPAALS